MWPGARLQSRRRRSAEPLRHMADFHLDLKFSAGIWYFALGGSSVHHRYTTPLDIPARAKIAANLKQ